MKRYRIIIDTNVLIAGLPSRRGASYNKKDLQEAGKFGIMVVTPNPEHDGKWVMDLFFIKKA